MADDDSGSVPHELDVSVWVGKRGVDAVTEEVDEQLADRDAVKVKFLRAGRAGEDVEALAAELADRVGGSVLDVRGHTAVIRR